MRLKFTLRTFLIGVALLASALGAFAFWRKQIVDRAERHARAMEALKLPLGGVMTASKTQPESRYEHFVRTWIHSRAFETCDRICAAKSFWTPGRLAHLKNVNGLSSIICSFDQLTCEDAQAICDIPALEELQVRFKSSEPGAAALLASKKTLTSLSIHGDAESTFVPALRLHPRLVKLRLHQIPLTAQDAQAIASIPHLEQFTANASLDGEHLPLLLKTKIKLLVVKLEDCDANALSGLRNSEIEQLDLTCRSFGPGALAAAAKTPYLRELSLSGELALGPGEFESLRQCTRLERLQLPSLWLTPEQWKIVTALPKLTWLVARSHESAKGCETAFLDSDPKRRFRSN